MPPKCPCGVRCQCSEGAEPVQAVGAWTVGPARGLGPTGQGGHEEIVIMILYALSDIK